MAGYAKVMGMRPSFQAAQEHGVPRALSRAGEARALPTCGASLNSLRWFGSPRPRDSQVGGLRAPGRGNGSTPELLYGAAPYVHYLHQGGEPHFLGVALPKGAFLIAETAEYIAGERCVLGTVRGLRRTAQGKLRLDLEAQRNAPRRAGTEYGRQPAQTQLPPTARSCGTAPQSPKAARRPSQLKVAISSAIPAASCLIIRVANHSRSRWPALRHQLQWRRPECRLEPDADDAPPQTVRQLHHLRMGTVVAGNFTVWPPRYRRVKSSR